MLDYVYQLEYLKSESDNSQSGILYQKITKMKGFSSWDDELAQRTTEHVDDFENAEIYSPFLEQSLNPGWIREKIQTTLYPFV
jgi:hypothetical protein